MDQSSSSLYSRPLSQAAQKILAVLRAQSQRASRHNHNYYNHSQMQRYNGSQRERLAQSSWSMSQEESKDTDRPWFRSQLSSFATSYPNSSNQCQSSQTSACYQSLQTPDCSPSSQASSCSSSCWDSSLQTQAPEAEAYYQCSQIYSHRKYSEPPTYRSSQSLSFTQHEVAETAASLSHKDRYTLSTQMPEKLFEHEATPWRISTEEIRPSFIHASSPDNEVPDEVLFPTLEQRNRKELSLPCHPVSSCLKISDNIDATSGTQKKMNVTESWNIPRNELEDPVGSDSQAKWKLPLSDPSEGATSGGEHQGTLHQQAESETIKTGEIHVLLSESETTQETCCDARSPKSMRNLDGEEGMELIVDSENITEAGMGQTSNIEHKIQNRVNGEHMDAVLLNEKGSALEIGGIKLLGNNKNTSLERTLMLFTTTMEKISACDTEGKNLVNTPEIKEVEHLPGSENKEISVGCHALSTNKILISSERGDRRQAENTQDIKNLTENSLVQCEAKSVLGENTSDNLKRATEDRIDMMEIRLKVETEIRSKAGIDTNTEEKMKIELHLCSDVQLTEKQCETHYREVNESGESGKDRGDSLMPPVDGDECTSTEDSGGESGSMPTSSQKCRAKRSGFRAPHLHGNHQHHDNIQLKRKHEELQHQDAHPPPKIYLTRCPSKWKPPHCSQEKAGEGGVNELRTARCKTPHPEPPATLSDSKTSHETGIVLETHKDPPASKQIRQIRHSKVEERCCESASKHTPSSVTCKPLKHKQAKCGPDQGTNGPKISHEGAKCGGPQNQSKAGCLTATLTSDPRVKDSGKMDPDEKLQMLEKAGKAKALLLTLVYRDGTTQLDPEQKLTPPVCGLLVLMKNNLNCSTPEDLLGPNDSLVYLKLEHTPASTQQHTHQSQELSTRSVDMLLQVLSSSQLVVCYKAKDLLRTALQFYKQDLSWKQVAGCRIQDPQVSGWLLDPANPSSCYQDLLNKHCKRPRSTPALGTKKVSQIISGLCLLYWLNMELCSKLQNQGLWELYSDMELNMIPVLAAMESHHIHVDKEALKRTSDLLGTKMKQLEQEAHQAAGQIFLVTSNTQLRTVLFEKLCLHEHCESKKLPKTINKQQQSTSEAALLQLQDLHPLPKIILEYRQVHKIKSTFVDGILSCMMSKNYISSSWYQTSVVTGRISAKHPNFQALPRQPLQLTKKQYIQGKEEEMVSVHPRAMFIPQEGWTFLAADFCQVELRLLAHLSSDPELLRIFTHPQADAFTMLASQWKGVSEGEVTTEDREHAKRIVYSVVYGAGCERLSGILGVSAEQARRFQDRFLQTYREVQAFIQRTIQQCHKQGYVLSIMGRRRTLPNINSSDWGIRMQAERQAVNFVVQGSAADLCKMAMIRIFNLVSSSSSLSARLIAQLHDELLYEVEDSQVEQFAALVKTTMESLQHIDHQGVHLKVPLKVAVSSGKSWGSMSELNIVPTPPSASR